MLMRKDGKTASDFVNLFTDSVIQVKLTLGNDITSLKNIVSKTLDVV